MRARPSLPSPLAGEGAERRWREAGEGSSRKATARSLRSRMTDAERKLWFALKDRRFQNLKFRRQVPVGPYVADFLCFDLRLVVEVDGGQHAESVRNAERDRWFADDGFHTLRFWNNDVLSNLEGVLTIIAEGAATPHPTARLRSPPPSPTGGEGSKEVF
ncbi:endonuclease domain-containing protein [Nitrobacter sp.]|uniref:endonuclease domain-containing protein n=1 Tax=Nitrobacter sp. TaxID=29420 RepID=UPI0029CAB876|nr:endonuclease domain-containing protein [Nitrobacter sp.]